MSEVSPDDDLPDRDTLAAEYLLGLLAPEQARDVARRLERDPALAGAVDGWAARLEPLAGLAAPAAPSDLLWSRIQRDLPRRAPVAPIRAAPARRRALAWSGWAAAAALLAGLLAGGHRLDVRIAWDATRPASPTAAAPITAPPVPPSPRTAAPVTAPAAPPRPLQAGLPVMPADKPVPPAPAHDKAGEPGGEAVALLTASGSDRPAMKAYIRQGGSVRLVAVQPVSLPPDKALGFWVWPHGAALPTPLGRVDASGGTLRFPFHEADGTPVMVTLEPRDLPVSTAQGPTLFTGQLVATD